ncbi:SRPBCC family protein [Nocardia sp. CDC153]|uniref:SRPBCC family protein n=1 Tax=Nocardia sp. CDC153 TaxID=3112167 RepID=UPI002DB5F572|nr:SRPBCC family protein [Nocardia sp. CDC153]MEC3953231.1 SRPBCC family protein [Nocardia sp. CDC153]
MRFQTRVDIDAEPNAVWQALIDVESWPKWTASMTSVERLQSGPLGVGSSARVVQPLLKPAVYTVTACEPGASFDWQTQLPGLTVSATHHLEALNAARTRLTLGVTQSGPLSLLAWPLFGQRTRRYVTMEAEGLKRAAESRST